MSEEKEIAKKINKEFDYTVKELLTEWDWIDVQSDMEEIYLNGTYVLFHEDKVIWY